MPVHREESVEPGREPRRRPSGRRNDADPALPRRGCGGRCACLPDEEDRRLAARLDGHGARPGEARAVEESGPPLLRSERADRELGEAGSAEPAVVEAEREVPKLRRGRFDRDEEAARHQRAVQRGAPHGGPAELVALDGRRERRPDLVGRHAG